MQAHTLRLEARLARSEDEIRAAQRLRYRVFVDELGGDGDGVDHAAGLETDAFDAHAMHLLLFDHARAGDPVVGVYRLMDRRAARAAGRFYSASEFDLAPLLDGGRELLELGRSCLDPAYRGGSGMMVLWNALARLVAAQGVEILFGVASFHGTDPGALAAPLSLLHHRHLAPADIRPVSRAPAGVPLLPEAGIDRLAAMRAVPALIKAYLRLGGHVGEGVFVDRAFNTTDVCLVLDVARMDPRQRDRFRDAG